MPLPRTRSRYLSTVSAVATGAVKRACAVSASISAGAASATALPSASTSTQRYSTLVPHGPPPVPVPPSITAAPAPTVRSVRSAPASATGRKLPEPGLPPRSITSMLASGSNTPSARLPAASALCGRNSSRKPPSPSNAPAGSAVRALLCRDKPVTPPSPAKSPAFSPAIPLFTRFSEPVIPPRCAGMTCEQSLASDTAATSASRTCAVRPHTPPVSAAVDPSTRCAASAARAVCASDTAAPAASRMALPAGVARPFAGTATPSSSSSPATTG